MATVDYFLSGDPEIAKQHLHAALQEQGFTVSTRPTGQWAAERGSKQKTFWLGAFAGKAQHLVFTVDFMLHGDQLVARIDRLGTCLERVLRLGHHDPSGCARRAPRGGSDVDARVIETERAFAYTANTAPRIAIAIPPTRRVADKSSIPRVETKFLVSQAIPL